MPKNTKSTNVSKSSKVPQDSAQVRTPTKPESSANPRPSRAFLALHERCTNAGLDSEITQEIGFELEDGAPIEEGYNLLRVRVPSGRSHREVRIPDSAEFLGRIAETSFETYRFIDGYEAIWCRDAGIIECLLGGGQPRLALRRVVRAIGIDTSQLSAPIPGFDYPSLDGGPAVSFGPCSPEFDVLTGRIEPPLARAVITIKNAELNTHDRAKELLEKVANSVLFQIDLAVDAPLFPAEERSREAPRRPRSAPPTFSAPKQEYDPEPMSLYWYARTAVGRPLLQYLAYYQVLEFYFPIYSEQEAHRVIQDRLKDPRFDATREADVSGLLQAIKASSGGRGFGDEKSQLRATVLACVTEDEMRDFFEETGDKREFFLTKQADVVVPQRRIPLANKDAELRPEVASRIYDIRCRIVHTKSGHEGEPALMLPFSKEARSLGYDLQLMAFVAREALVAASRPLRF